MKLYFLFLALGLMACTTLAQTSASFIAIPANQYGQHGTNVAFSNCDTTGNGRTKDLNSTQLAFFLKQHPDTFSLFVVENVRTYPTTISIYDTLSISKASGTSYNYVTQNAIAGNITQVSTSPLQYSLVYTLPTFSSYKQWRNSFVQIHFKVKGDSAIYLMKDTTLRANVLSPLNLKTNGLILSSVDLKNKIKWTIYGSNIFIPYGDTTIFNQAFVPMLWDATYEADENSVYNDYVKIGDGRLIVACTSSVSLIFKAIKDSTGNGLLKAPEQLGATYQWYFKGKPISNANSSIYQASSSGTYGVSVTFDFNAAAANLRTEGSNLVTGNYSFNYTATITEIESDILNPKDKILVRVYNPLGQVVKPEDALQGMFIYQFSDGSTRKVMKQE